MGVPIRALIGVNVLRHVNATVDFEGNESVVRNFAPPPPPAATRLDLRYVRGGAMVVKRFFGADGASPADLYVDTQRPFPPRPRHGGMEKGGS